MKIKKICLILVASIFVIIMVCSCQGNKLEQVSSSNVESSSTTQVERNGGSSTVEKEEEGVEDEPLTREDMVNELALANERTSEVDSVTIQEDVTIDSFSISIRGEYDFLNDRSYTNISNTNGRLEIWEENGKIYGLPKDSETNEVVEIGDASVLAGGALSRESLYSAFMNDENPDMSDYDFITSTETSSGDLCFEGSRTYHIDQLSFNLENIGGGQYSIDDQDVVTTKEIYVDQDGYIKRISFKIEDINGVDLMTLESRYSKFNSTKVTKMA